MSCHPALCRRRVEYMREQLGVQAQAPPKSQPLGNAGHRDGQNQVVGQFCSLQVRQTVPLFCAHDRGVDHVVAAVG